MNRVLKFGGASIRDSREIENVFSILSSYKNGKIVIIFSAIANVTNLLEELVDLHLMNDLRKQHKLVEIHQIHLNIVKDLFEKNHSIYNKLNNLIDELRVIIDKKPESSYSFIYDQIVSYGELMSTKILNDYLNLRKFNCILLDARDLVKTDSKYQNAKIDWSSTKKNIKKIKLDSPIITQGFIGSNTLNQTTTLGREGSDFTAAIFANILNADEVIIWKDVNGVLNADPRYFNDTILLSNLSYSEAIELAFYGAKVIHPRTIQPLQEKDIPLSVRSFININEPGTVIAEIKNNKPITSYIVKENQVLISISDINLSFIVEEHLSWIFSVLSKYDISVNLMQNSAVSFSVCIDNKKNKVLDLVTELSTKFKVYYNNKVKLFTIRHYSEDSTNKVINGKSVLLEQKSRNTVQYVVS
ncbi:MAG: aspartate kinase [Flavobacteriales bacterium]